MAETPVHRDLLLDLVHQLIRWYDADPTAYVSGNMRMYYVEGDKRRHVSPDVFVTLGLADGARVRDAYFVWVEGKGPDFVIELTSNSTRLEDQKTKLELYRDRTIPTRSSNRLIISGSKRDHFLQGDQSELRRLALEPPPFFDKSGSIDRPTSGKWPRELEENSGTSPLRTFPAVL